jgi:hypothetical protein
LPCSARMSSLGIRCLPIEWRMIFSTNGNSRPRLSTVLRRLADFESKN